MGAKYLLYDLYTVEGISDYRYRTGNLLIGGEVVGGLKF